MSVIGAIGSIVGGLFGRQKPYYANRQAKDHVEGLMMASKEFNINPLTLLGAGIPSGGYGPGPNPIGQSISDAALLLGDTLAQRPNQAAMKLNEYQRQNRKLTEKVARLSLQPVVPGVFSERRAAGLPPIAAPNGGANAKASAPALDDPLRDPVVLNPADAGGIAVPDPRLDRGVGGYVGGARWDSRPGWSPTQIIEDDYGDVVSWGYGAAKGLADLGHNARRWTDSIGLTEPGVNLVTGAGRKDKPKAKSKRKPKSSWPYPVRNFDPSKRDGYYMALP